jgi:hypothetical protein
MVRVPDPERFQGIGVDQQFAADPIAVKFLAMPKVADGLTTSAKEGSRVFYGDCSPWKLFELQVMTTSRVPVARNLR